MLEFYFIRHGESVGNREDRFRGRHDFPLNINGIQQAECLQQALFAVKFETIYTSPLIRASKTAEILSAGKFPVKLENGLTNISLGSWENMLKSDVKEKYPDLWQLWKKNPEKLSFQGMETLQMVKKRSYQTLEKIMTRHSSGKIAIVSHRAVLKPLFAAILSMSEPFFWKIQIDTASFSIAEFRAEKGFTFTKINESSHLLDFTREDLG